jgi:CubicO group peptidase (beta-lactamase class C family)
MKNKLVFSLGVIVVIGGLTWSAIGPDWRAFLSNPPTDALVLSWSHEQRTNAFRMMDAIPLLAKAETVHIGKKARTFEQGPALELDIDFDSYFKKQNHAAGVIIHTGAVRLQRYGLGFTDNGKWTSFSVAKSLTSTLVGAALKDGYIESLNDNVSKYITGLKGSAYDDVTIEQLLTMTSGVAWNEDYDDPASDVALFNEHESDEGTLDLVDYMKDLPRAHDAGEVWHYSTGETNLIGILVNKATGISLSKYLSEKIWKPYGMQQEATWLLSGDGLEIGGCCVQATTMDFARVGQFILEGAKIEGESIVPDNWIASATRKKVDIGQRGHGYGYQWWTNDDGSYDAKGIFGQGIFIDPKRRLIIATNSSWTQATGEKDDESARLSTFYDAVQKAIDQENLLKSNN